MRYRLVESIMVALRGRRLSLGLSQRALSELIGMSQPVLAAYEKGARQPGIDSVGRVAAGLGARVGIVSVMNVSAIVHANPGMRREALLSLVGVVGLCLEPHDLCTAKLIANRPKDLDFLRSLLDADLVQAARLFERLAATECSPARRSFAAGFLRPFGRRTT